MRNIGDEQRELQCNELLLQAEGMVIVAPFSAGVLCRKAYEVATDGMGDGSERERVLIRIAHLAMAGFSR